MLYIEVDILLLPRISGFHGNAQGTAQYACRSEGHASTAVNIGQTRLSRPQSQWVIHESIAESRVIINILLSLPTWWHFITLWPFQCSYLTAQDQQVWSFKPCDHVTGLPLVREKFWKSRLVKYWSILFYDKINYNFYEQYYRGPIWLIWVQDITSANISLVWKCLLTFLVLILALHFLSDKWNW